MKENLISENLPPGDENSKQKKKYLRLKNMVRQHPYWSVILLSIYTVIVLEGIIFLVFLMGLYPYGVRSVPGSMIAEALFVLLGVFVPLYVLDWWNTAGFQTLVTWPLRIRGYKALFLGLFFLLCFVPLLLLTFSQTIHRTPLSTIVMFAVLCLFVGIAEEGVFRGLILNILLPKGIWKAVLLSSLLFGSLHILNVFVGFPLNAVVGEMFFAMGFGMLLAAVRLRTNSLRPGIIAHGLWDLPLLILNSHRQRILSPSLLQLLVVVGIMCAIYVACVLIVLRPKRLRELRVMYGLVPAPPDPYTIAQA